MTPLFHVRWARRRATKKAPAKTTLPGGSTAVGARTGVGRGCSLRGYSLLRFCCWLSKFGQICPKVAEFVQNWTILSKNGQSCPKLDNFVQKWRGTAFSLKRESSKSNLKDAALALSFELRSSPRLCYARPHAWFARAMHHFPTPLLRKCLATLDPQWAKETAASADPFFLLRPLPYRGSALFWDSQQINTECLI